MLKKFLKIFYIEFPNSRIDDGINNILINFSENIFSFRKIFSLFSFEVNSKYESEDIELFYVLNEFYFYFYKILLDNPHFLNNHFNESDLYVKYEESACYFIFMKMKILFYQTVRDKLSIFDRIGDDYRKDLEDKINFNIYKYDEFFHKDLDLNRKKELILEEYNENIKKYRQYLFITLWIIQNDIDNNILDNNITNLEEFKVIQKISELFLKDKIVNNDFIEIDILQSNYKVIENYKLFKEFFTSV
tara:strand:+ start:468 stop:1208 length:741 start_codon:yes stop_codon:yes gene_type:complete